MMLPNQKGRSAIDESSTTNEELNTEKPTRARSSSVLSNGEGSRRGWVMVGAVFFSSFIIFGNVKALGVIVIVLKDDMEADLWIVGWIAVMYLGFQFILAPFPAAVSRLVGARPVVITGGVLTGLGFALSTTSSTVAELIFYLAVLAGSGSACTFVILLGDMSLYFDKNYPLACAIGLCGMSVGFMVYGPISQLLLNTYGWRGTCLLLGGFSFHLVVCGALARPHTNGDYRSVSTQEQCVPAPAKLNDTFGMGERECSDPPSRKTNRLENPKLKRLKIGCEELWRSLDLTVFRDTRFNLQMASAFFSEFGYEGWLVFLVSFGQLTGLTPLEASFLPVAVGFGNILGKIACSVLLKGLPAQCVAAAFAVVACISFAVAPFSLSFIGQLLTTFVTAAALGVFNQIGYVLLRHVLSEDRIASVFSYHGLTIGVSGIIGGFFSGWLYDVTGSTTATYIMFSASMIPSGTFIMADYAYVRYFRPVVQ